VPGVVGFAADTARDLVVVRYDPRRVGVRAIAEALARAGYPPRQVVESRLVPTGLPGAAR
jgi:copper chaperone CopZ